MLLGMVDQVEGVELPFGVRFLSSFYAAVISVLVLCRTPEIKWH